MKGNTEGKKACLLMNTKRAQSARLLSITPRQRGILIGSLLGDGHLAKTTRGYAFRVNHGLVQKEYVDWKYQELSSLTNSVPNTYKSTYYFRTVSHQYFDELRNLFYRGEKKIIPENIGHLLTPLAIAVWFMDDGTKEGKQARINSQSFTREENQKLSHLLEATLGIKSTINRDKHLFRLRISNQSMSLFRNMVAPYIVPSMRYKLSL
ncbi:MAG TPA: hypothetical protein DEF00_03815 [Candidatus Taylorbacteria bacterium]|nr:MAG: LAGLIDADG homing endonuclease [Parcubacteria group bacterium GW2011_GWA2_47_64]KKU95595.1 MAG: LAGLIDADG homing endonuclease [Parcubacteria group bacterium GW2011_GWC2_48_17]HBV01485.1 hypothetical protein [Candidatus Taylorbacteria bacterium]